MGQHVRPLPSGSADDSEPTLATIAAIARIRRIAFTALVGLFTLFQLLAFNALFLLAAVLWMPDDFLLSLPPEVIAGDVGHRLHFLALSVFIWIALIGTVVQLRKPEIRQAPMIMALSVPVALAVGELVTGTYTFAGTAPLLVPLALITLLHPSLGQLYRVRKMERTMAASVVPAAAALAPFAYQQGQLQHLAVPGDTHAALGHWSYMVSYALLIVLLGLLGASDRSGWRLVAWVSGSLAVMLGLQSLMYPTAASTIAFPWAVAALLWGAAYLYLTERRARQGTS